MKRVLILGICAAMLLVQLFSGVVTVVAADTDITITGYTTDKDSLSEGDQFNLALSIRNNSADSISDIYAIVDSASSFYGVDTNTFQHTPAVTSGSSISIPMKLIYRGSGQELKVAFKYSVAGVQQSPISQTISIKNAHESSNTPSTPTDTTKYAPKLTAVKDNSAVVAIAGITNTITVPIKNNNSSYAAKAVSVSLEMDDKTKSTQVLDSFSMVQSFDNMNANETKNAVFNLKVLSSAPEGIYAFKLNYNFMNYFNDSFTTSETVYIKIVNGNTTPRLTVDSISTDPTVAVPGQNVNLKVKIANLGSLPAKDIKVTLKGLKNGGFITNNSTDIKYITKVDGQGTATVSYSLTATTGIPSGSNELQVKIDYSDGTGAAPLSEENQIFIPVSRTGAGKGLVIQSIQSPQGTITPNNDFKVAFTLANTGLTDISNIKVSLASDKEIVCKSMNSILVDTLAKGETRKFEFTLFAAQEATTRNYPVALNVEYDAAQGDTTKATVSQYVGVFVENGTTGKSIPKIIIDKYSFEPAEIKAGDEFTLKMSYLNTSRTVNISNIKVTVSSDDGTFTPVNSSNTFFIDSLASKSNIEKTLVLKAKPGAEPKAYALSVNFDYEDDKGNPQTTKEVISIPVDQPPRLVTGDINVPTDGFTQQPIPLSIEFYNMGKVTLYNMMVKADGDFIAQNGRYFVGNFESGRSDSFEVQITPKAAGQMKGNIIFSFENAAGKTIEVKKDFEVNITDMPMEKPMDGAMGIGPDGKPINPNAPKGFNYLFVAIPGGVLVLGIVLFVVIRKKRIRRRELSLDE